MPFQIQEQTFSGTRTSLFETSARHSIVRKYLFPSDRLQPNIFSSTCRRRCFISFAALAAIVGVGLWALSEIVSVREQAHRAGACLALDTGAMYGAIDDKTRRMAMRAMTRNSLYPNTVSMGSYRVLSATCSGLRAARLSAE